MFSKKRSFSSDIANVIITYLTPFQIPNFITSTSASTKFKYDASKTQLDFPTINYIFSSHNVSFTGITTIINPTIHLHHQFLHSLFQFPSLKILNLTATHNLTPPISPLSISFITNLPNLRTLILSHFILQSLLPLFSHNKLRHLDISKSTCSNPAESCVFIHLKKLRLLGIPTNVKFNLSLLPNHNIKHLIITPSSTFYNFPNLHFIKFYMCSTIPDLSTCYNLTHIKLELCHLRDINNLRGIISLVSFEVHNCHHLREIGGLEDAINLKHLSIIGCNNIYNIDGIKNCVNLESIHLFNNKSLSHIHGLNKCSKLKIVKIANCQKIPHINIDTNSELKNTKKHKLCLIL